MIESTCGGIEVRRTFFPQCSGHGTFSNVQFDFGGLVYGLDLTFWVVITIIVSLTLTITITFITTLTIILP